MNTAQTHSNQHHHPYLQNSLNYCHSLPSSRRSEKNIWEGSAVATQNPPHCQLLVFIEHWIEELLISYFRDLNFIHCIFKWKDSLVRGLIRCYKGKIKLDNVNNLKVVVTGEHALEQFVFFEAKSGKVS